MLKPDDRVNNYERSVQLSSLLSLSLPKAELRAQKIIHDIKKRKSLLLNQRRQD